MAEQDASASSLRRAQGIPVLLPPAGSSKRRDRFSAGRFGDADEHAGVRFEAARGADVKIHEVQGFDEEIRAAYRKERARLES